jgi:DNA-binding GntR family transcriptional regulator
MMVEVRHRTKTELALHVLRERILIGELEPGRRLRLASLTEELGMSPTPIREALRLLQADGIVTYRPHQGIVVAEVSVELTDEVIRLRRELEAMATRLAVPRMDAAGLARVERLHARHVDAVEAGRGTAVSKQNADWHWAIYEASGSSLLLEFGRRLWEVYPWRTMWVLPGRIAQSAVEHEEIMEAIRSGHADRAGSLMGAHVGGSRDSLLTRLGDTKGERE